MSLLDILRRINPSDLDAIPVVVIEAPRRQIYPCCYCGTDLRGLMAISCTGEDCEPCAHSLCDHDCHQAQEWTPVGGWRDKAGPTTRVDGFGSCPYYLNRGKPDSPDAVCGFGCHQEPRCMTDEPAGGWRVRDAATGRFVPTKTSTSN